MRVLFADSPCAKTAKAKRIAGELVGWRGHQNRDVGLMRFPLRAGPSGFVVVRTALDVAMGRFALSGDTAGAFGDFMGFIGTPVSVVCELCGAARQRRAAHLFGYC